LSAMSLSASDFRQKMLGWYDNHRRTLPWRALPQETTDPYHVWLSEIMLQQTTVQAVKSYFIKFLKKWPTIGDMASASQEEIIDEWAGLGYYARARNLHKCAKTVTADYKGNFPSNYEQLLELPGIGPYTAAAITSIAFNKPANVVDGNVERVMARYYCIETPFPEGKTVAKEKASLHIGTFEGRNSDYAQSLMDLGATICRPKNPVCGMCPLNNSCCAYSNNLQNKLPKRVKKKAKPHKQASVYIIFDPHTQKLLLERRPETGLLANTAAFPTSEWLEVEKGSEAKNKAQGNIIHVFTHFSLTLTLKIIKTDENFVFSDKLKRGELQWVDLKELEKIKFPSLFKKVYRMLPVDILNKVRE